MTDDSYTVSDKERKQFAATYILDRMVSDRLTFPVYLEGQDRDLEPILEYMLTHDHVAIKNNKYTVAPKGQELLKKFKQRYADYLKNFDVYCAIDLEEGDFAFQEWFDFEDDDEWDAYLEEDRWEDLRVAVADFKNLNPVEIVFMSFINEERFGDRGEGWQFDLLLGSIWDEILAICDAALHADDLAYEDDEGNQVAGEDVLKDILAQGAELNMSIREEEEKQEKQKQQERQAQASRSSSEYAPWKRGGEDRVVVEYQVYERYHDPYYRSPVWGYTLFTT